MDKKTIKAILDVIKDVSDRPGLYGAQFIGSTLGNFLFFTDGYVCIRLDVEEFPHELMDKYWISGDQLKEIYKKMGAKDYATSFKNDKGGVHPDWLECWRTWTNVEGTKDPVPIRPETFKKLAPFGDMLMTVNENKLGQKNILFSGKGINAVAMPLAHL